MHLASAIKGFHPTHTSFPFMSATRYALSRACALALGAKIEWP